MIWKNIYRLVQFIFKLFRLIIRLDVVIKRFLIDLGSNGKAKLYPELREYIMRSPEENKFT